MVRNTYHSDTRGRVEVLSYAPNLQDSGDLESAQHGVTVTSQPVLPDYSTSLTVPAPADARWVVKRVGVRLAVTIDSLAGSTLYGSLQVNGSERKTFTLTGTGEKFTGFDLTEGQFQTGAPTLYDLFLWTDAGEAVVSQCRIWQGVGSADTGYNYPFCLQLMHEGLVQWMIETNRTGTGSGELRIGQGGSARPSCYQAAYAVYSVINPPLQLASNHGIGMRVGTAGDLGSFYGYLKAVLYHHR